MALPNTRFIGELDGTTLYELNKKLDYRETHLDKRKEIVEGILNDTTFYADYFDKHFKVTATASTSLSHQNGVCRSLERMADYLLNSKEIKQNEDKEKIKYVFYTDPRYFQKKLNKESSYSSYSESSDIESENIIHFLKVSDPNSKKGKAQKITKSDLSRKDELGRILREYMEFHEYVSKELRNPETQHNRYHLTQAKGSLSDDMIYVKDSYLGVFGYHPKNLLPDSTEYNLDIFDFTNDLHLRGRSIKDGGKRKVKGLIYFKNDFDPNNDMTYILMDLKATIEKAGLTLDEKTVLKYLQEGWINNDIAEELQWHHVKVARCIDGIVKKIIAVGETYDKKEIS